MKYGVKPSRQASRAGFFVSLFMVAFGILFLFLVAQTLIENEAPRLMQLVFYVFMLGWLGLAVSAAVFHARNASSARGVSMLEVEADADHADDGPMQRLRALEGLKQDGLINDEEYQRKRAQIMNEKW